MSASEFDIASLSPSERLDLLERLWDSLTPAPDDIPLTDAQRAELDHRIDALDRDGPVGMSWDEALQQARQR